MKLEFCVEDDNVTLSPLQILTGFVGEAVTVRADNTCNVVMTIESHPFEATNVSL